MKKEKTLFLVESDPSNIFINDLKANDYKVCLFFKEINIILRIVRRIWLKLNFPFADIWFDVWYKKLDSYDELIINVNRLNHKLFNYISKKNKKTRIIGWYWNIVDNKNYPIEYNNTNIEYWSFDKNDCEKYGLKKNIQYYSYPKNIKGNKDIDIYYIGREKGRSEKIQNFIEIAELENLNCDINIIHNNNIVPYEKVKEKLSKSKAVLEINIDNQIGLTLRALESLFFEIKLITNNKNITNLNFYSKKNIYIIGVDKYSIKKFINSDYDHSIDCYKSDYDIDTWYNNFCQ